jgi:acyl carrier protein
MAVYSENEVFLKVRTAMVDLFELEEAMITPQALLFDQLGLDSIDAVDLVVRLKNETGITVRPEEFKTVRTVDDVVKAVHRLLPTDHA